MHLFIILDTCSSVYYILDTSASVYHILDTSSSVYHILDTSASVYHKLDTSASVYHILDTSSSVTKGFESFSLNSVVCRRPWYFKRWNLYKLSLKNVWFTPLDCRDMWIWPFVFEAQTHFRLFEYLYKLLRNSFEKTIFLFEMIEYAISCRGSVLKPIFIRVEDKFLLKLLFLESWIWMSL